MTPTAPSAYILARQLDGGDTETMSSIKTFQSLLAFLVIPAIALIMLKPFKGVLKRARIRRAQEEKMTVWKWQS